PSAGGRRGLRQAGMEPGSGLWMKVTDDADAAQRTIARLCFDNDLDILSERGQEAHQAFAREVRKTSIEQRRYLWLIEPHERGCRDLGQAPALQNLPDVARKLRFGELLLGFRQADVGKDIAAARGHPDFGISFSGHCW